MALRQAPLRQVLLVVLFRPVKILSGSDLRHDRTPEIRLRFLKRSSGRSLLLRRAILRANIGTLAVLGCRIVVRPEGVEQLVVADLRRIVIHFDDLGMTRTVRADILIGWILKLAAFVS